MALAVSEWGGSGTACQGEIGFIGPFIVHTLMGEGKGINIKRICLLKTIIINIIIIF